MYNVVLIINTVKPFIRVTNQNEKSLWSLMGSGCLYESQTAGSYFRGKARTHLLFGVNVLHAIFRFNTHNYVNPCLVVCFHVQFLFSYSV